MSGLFLSLASNLPGAVERLAADIGYADQAWTEVLKEAGATLVQVRADWGDLWQPARDPDTGMVVAVAGRIALDTADWERARSLPYEGGWAARHILGAFLADPTSFAESLNGAFGVAVVQPREGTVHVVTDRMGFLPLYCWNTNGPPVIGTHPDVLADYTGATHDLDVLSMAEVLATGSASHPHTYYRDIRVLDPGRIYTWTTGGLADGTATERTYWEPTYRGENGARVPELGEDLEVALRRAVERRTNPALGSAGVLLSGGADSRAVLYAACAPEAVTSLTFYDRPNAELATARRLAERVGSRHLALQRDFEHYGLGAPEAVRVTGGMWNLRDAHYTEFVPEIRALDLDTLLTGCYADYLFKGLTSNRVNRTLFGKNLPLYDFAPFSPRWYTPHGPVAEEWQRPVGERMRAMYDGVDLADTSDAGRWGLELRRIRPVTMEADTAGRLLLQRTLPWDPIFADTDLVDLYERVPPSLKLNGQVWEDAVGRICRTAGDIANNNSLSRIGASDLRKTLSFARGVVHRKVFGRDVDGTPLDGGAARGSWPDFNHYILHSTVVPELWANPAPLTREVLTKLVGQDPWNTSMWTWAKRGSVLFFRLLTLKLWLDQRTS